MSIASDMHCRYVKSIANRVRGAIYHVVAHGNLKQAIFRSARDRLRLLDRLEETASRHQLRVYAWTLMTTHYHLLLCTPRANLSRAMHQLQSSYSTYVRARHNLSGHVFGGRYKARLVEGDPYLLALTRYIHLNPIHTRHMRERPLEERLAFLKNGHRPVWLTIIRLQRNSPVTTGLPSLVS